MKVLRDLYERVRPSYSRSPSQRFSGHLDKVDRNEIAGWVIDNRNPHSSLYVVQVSEGTIVQTVRADLEREDVYRAGFGSAKCGFKLAVKHDNSEGTLHVASVPEPVLAETKPWKSYEVAPVDLKAVSHLPESSTSLIGADTETITKLRTRYRWDRSHLYFFTTKYNSDLSNVRLLKRAGALFRVEWEGLNGWGRVIVPLRLPPSITEETVMTLRVGDVSPGARLETVSVGQMDSDGRVEPSFHIQRGWHGRDLEWRIDPASGAHPIQFLIIEFSRSGAFTLSGATLGIRRGRDADFPHKPHQSSNAELRAKDGIGVVLRSPPPRGSAAERKWLLDVLELMLKHEMLGRAQALADLLWSVRGQMTDSEFTRLIVSRVRVDRAIHKNPPLDYVLSREARRAEGNPLVRSAQDYAIRRALISRIDAEIEPSLLGTIANSDNEAERLNSCRNIETLGLEECLAIASSFAKEYRRFNPRSRAPSTFDGADIHDNYLKWINNALAFIEAPRVISVDLAADNVLSTIAFEEIYQTVSGPLVTIVMSCFNSKDTVGYAIRSILEQSYQNLELLVCDDLSSDESMNEIMKVSDGDPRVRVFSSGRRQGTYNIRNHLLKMAQGEYVTFQDADDFALPGRIARQVSEILSRNVHAVMASWIRILPNGEFVVFSDGKVARQSVVSLMAPPFLYQECGPYLSARFGADTHFLETVRQQSDYRIAFIEEPLLLGLWSDGSLTRTRGIECTQSGYRASSRRDFAELCAERRLLGPAIVDDENMAKRMKSAGAFIKKSSIKEMQRSGR